MPPAGEVAKPSRVGKAQAPSPEGGVGREAHLRAVAPRVVHAHEEAEGGLGEEVAAAANVPRELAPGDDEEEVSSPELRR